MTAPSAPANPYETPRSALRELGARLERRLVIKLYLGLAVAAALPRWLTAEMAEPARPLELLGLALVVSAFPALFGYAFRRRIGRSWLWKLWLPLPIAGSLLAELDWLPVSMGAGSPYVYARLFDAPLCAALFLYAFRSPDIWRVDEH